MVFSGASIFSPNGNVDFNSVVDFEYTTLTDAGGNNLKMSAKAFQYDYNGNLTLTTEYDWFDPALVSRDSLGVPTGVPGSAVVLRTVSNSYHNAAMTSTSGNVYAKRNISTATPLILSALQQTTTGPAITQLSYDNQSYGTAPTIGNVTSQKVWVDLDSKWITSSQTYNSYGNITTRTDPRGNVTEFHYDDSTHALPTRVVVDPQNGTGTQTTMTEFDFHTGLVKNQTDPNGNITTVDYTNQLLSAVDPFGRPGIIYGPTISSQRHRVTTTYLDNARQTIVATDLSTPGDKLLKTRTTSDQLGRVTLTEQTEDGTNYTISAANVYQQMGKITFSSNPKRSSGASTDGWTRTTLDTAGRVIEVASFSGAAQPPATGTNANWTGSVTTAYEANFTTVTDQAGKLRRSMVDALGRLIRVDEPDASNSLGTTASPVQPTNYSYNVLGNLVTVSQGAQTRTFSYDSLSRLRSATNPESGTTTYNYDDSGNLITRQDARSITTTISYDAINRPKAKTYSDGTPRIDYFYDTQSLPTGAPTFDRGHAKGRLVAVTYGGGSAGTYRGYDGRGLVVRQYQQTDSVNYLAEATYRLNGSLQTETYPSVPGAADRRLLNYNIDNAGRVASLSTSAASYAPAASVSSINYTAPGALSSQTYGNSLVHAVSYNSRLQTSEIRLGTGSNPTSVVSIAYNYGTTNNNGNVQSITYAGGGLSYTQSFGYDSSNRLTTSNENSGANWSQTNGYDRYGNRWVDLGGGNQSLYFTASNNRITGSSYDTAGNLLNDGTHSYTYDAENKIAKVDNVNAYVYDGEGQRVRKLLGENLRFVYGIGGQLIMEFSGSTGSLTKEYIYGAGGLLATIEPTAVNSNGTRYTTADHLSSPRVVTNSSAVVMSRHDYEPFGEELAAGVGGRTTGMGFPGMSDGLRQKFTSKERDLESGLDYFKARYYSSSQGRFTSIDPREINFEAATEEFQTYLGNPQNWNRYAYVLNSPLVLLDQDGREPNKAQAGTVADVVAVILKIENDNPTASQTEILQRVDGYFQSKDDTNDKNVRYVYTKENGWVDMKHFFAAAAEAATSTFGEVETLGKGLVIEVIQTIQGSDSAFSYEDLPSNAAGAEFGDEEFKPSGEKLSGQVKTFLEKTLQATAPQFAPNYSALPSGPTSAQGSRSNQSTQGRNDSASANNARNNRRGGTINPPRRRP
jgi:RHS repeat-associated protein